MFMLNQNVLANFAKDSVKDILIAVILIKIMYYFIDNISSYIDKIIVFTKKYINWNETYILFNIVEYEYWSKQRKGTCYNLSPFQMALFSYLNKNIENYEKCEYGCFSDQYKNEYIIPTPIIRLELEKNIYIRYELDKTIPNVVEKRHSFFLITTKTGKHLNIFMEKLIEEFKNEKEKKVSKELLIFNNTMDDFKKYNFITNCNIENIYFDDKENILKQIDSFKNNETFYKKIGKPYTLGILLYGHPGTGKSTFCKSLAKYLNRHIININFNKIKNCSQLEISFYLHQ